MRRRCCILVSGSGRVDTWPKTDINAHEDCERSRRKEEETNCVFRRGHDRTAVGEAYHYGRAPGLMG
jgi:hypothetical protein